MDDAVSFLLIITGISTIGGIIFGLYYTRIFSFIFDLNKIRNHQNISTTKIEEEEKKVNEQEDVLNTKPDLITKKSQVMEDELKIYQFEKDLASHAIENILIASKNNEIDSYEKDRLLLKYKDQLKKLNEKLEKIHSEIDVTDLINLRNDLAFLLDNKISNIDQKISEINIKIGTNYKVKQIVNQNKKNKIQENNIKNITNHFVDNIEETVDSNLNIRELTSYKNNPTQKRKDATIDTERKKIDELKDQVLVALNRLDKTENSKIELDDYNHNNPKKVTEDKTITLADKDLAIPNNYHNKLEISKQEDLSIQNNKKSLNNLIENNLNIPKIFSHTDISAKDGVITNKVAFEPRGMAEERLKNYKVEVNQNRTNESKSLAELDMEKRYIDIEKKYQEVNKKTPLSNLLNRDNLNFDHSVESKYKESNISNDQINKGKQSINNNSNKKDKKYVFKFPFALIFSRINKKVKDKRTQERADKKNIERKDSLSNIVNKKDKRE